MLKKIMLVASIVMSMVLCGCARQETSNMQDAVNANSAMTESATEMKPVIETGSASATEIPTKAESATETEPATEEPEDDWASEPSPDPFANVPEEVIYLTTGPDVANITGERQIRAFGGYFDDDAYLDDIYAIEDYFGEGTTEEYLGNDHEYTYYNVPDEFAAEVGGFFVMRDGELYSINSYLPPESIEKWHCGFWCENGYVKNFLKDEGDVRLAPTDHPSAYLSFDGARLLPVHQDDVVIGYSTDNMELIEVNFGGFTVPIVERTSGPKSLEFVPVVNRELPTEDSEIAQQEKTNIQIVNMDGTPVQDIRILENGKMYKYTYMVDDKYYEIELKANCEYYGRGSKRRKYIISKYMDESGYYSYYDLRGVEPGLYACNETVFEVIP